MLTQYSNNFNPLFLGLSGENKKKKKKLSKTQHGRPICFYCRDILWSLILTRKYVKLITIKRIKF